MTDPIHLSFDIRAYNEPAINARMLHRNATGRLKSVSFFLLPFTVAMALGTLAGQLFLGLHWPDAALVAGYAGLGSFFTAFVLGLRHRKHLASLMRDSPLRALPYEVVLSQRGVDRSGRHYPWSVFPGVALLPSMTVLQFSAVDGIILPDKELPKGLTPDALRTQIDEWRKAAT